MFATRPIVVSTPSKAFRLSVMNKPSAAVNRQGNRMGVCGRFKGGLPPGVAPMRR
jgi:hypothetical protein